MANNETTATLSMDADDQLVRLPSGWHLPGTQVRVRREGERVVLEPVDPPSDPSLPPGFWEWFDAARARGDFDLGEDALREIALRDLHLQDVNLDELDRDEPR